MENQNEMVLRIISELSKVAEAPCKKKLQKIIYLIEERNVDLGFQYKIHIYGPYSADLDYTICELKAGSSLDIEYTKTGHILKCLTEIPEETIPKGAEEVINTFGKNSPSELELITTTLFAQRHIENKEDQSIIRAVLKIKGKKFSEEKVEAALQLLKETRFICA